MTVANVEMAAAWDGAEGQHWAAHAERYEAASILHWQVLVHSIDIATNDVVLDIGCGTGRSTRELARMAVSGCATHWRSAAPSLSRCSRTRGHHRCRFRTLAEHETDDGVMFAASSWLTTARLRRVQPPARPDPSP